MYIYIHPTTPQPRLIQQVVQVLLSGGVIIYPTDTIYGLGCSIHNHKAIEAIAAIKHIKPEKANFSFVCSDLSNLSDYTKSINTPTYRLLKEHLPGPYTFILPASKQVPKILQTKKSTIGLRIPNNVIPLAIVKELGHPILSASLPGEYVEEYTDPDIINDNFGSKVQLVIDGGIGGIVPSTIVDLTGDEPVVMRQGQGLWLH